MGSAFQFPPVKGGQGVRTPTSNPSTQYSSGFFSSCAASWPVGNTKGGCGWADRTLSPPGWQKRTLKGTSWGLKESCCPLASTPPSQLPLGSSPGFLLPSAIPRFLTRSWSPSATHPAPCLLFALAQLGQNNLLHGSCTRSQSKVKMNLLLKVQND